MRAMKPNSRLLESGITDLPSQNQWFLPKLLKQPSLAHLDPVDKRQTSKYSISAPKKNKKNLYLQQLMSVLLKRTSSKATTNWPRSALATHMPKALHQSLKTSRYYVSSSDSISIQCDSHRGQTENEEENYRRLHDEISQIYKRSIPGVTSQEKKQKHEELWV